MLNTVSCDWLHRNKGNPDVVVLDATLAPVGSTIEPAITACIPGSIRFSIDDISDPDVQLPHTLLAADKFQLKARQAGINNSSTIIVHDAGMYSAPRVWWNFRIMGHGNVFVLNGGLSAWIDSGGTTAAVHDTPTSSGNFVAHEDRSLTVSLDEVLNAINDSASRIIDVRKAERYMGQEDEPRPGLRKGHIPSSINIPFSRFLDGICLRDADQLRQVFAEAGCSTEDRLIFSCGSGVTACIGLLAAHTSGFRNITLYDGSWAEWGANPNLPIA